MIPELLNHSDPTRLADEATPEQIADALFELAEDDPWPEWTLSLLDSLFIVWGVEAIARPNDSEGLAELQTTVNFALNRTRNRQTLPEQWRHRWSGIHDLLESRRMDLKGRNPEQVLGKKHVATLLELLAQGCDSQSALAEGLQARSIAITPGRLSQLLSLMEGNDLIARQKQGREKRVSLSEQGRRHVEQQDETPPHHAPASLTLVHVSGKGLLKANKNTPKNDAADPAQAVVKETSPWLERA